MRERDMDGPGVQDGYASEHEDRTVLVYLNALMYLTECFAEEGQIGSIRRCDPAFSSPKHGCVTGPP